MAKCTDCLHYGACSGFTPTDQDKDVWDYCKNGIPEKIPDIENRCDGFKDGKSWVEVVRCKDCKHCERDHTLDAGGDEYYYCTHDVMEHGQARANEFCSYGERKDNE